MNKASSLIFTLISSSILLNANNTTFDYQNFKEDFNSVKTSNSVPWYDFWSSNDDASDEDSYAKRKYGREIVYKDYDEIKADRKRKNSILSIGSTYTSLRTIDTYYKMDGIPSIKTDTIDHINKSFENQFTTTLDLRTLLDLKYFNIQEETKNTYLGATLGNYMDIDVSKDLFNGRETDFYLLVGPMMRVDLKSDDELISFGLKSSLGYFFTDKIGVFYSMAYGKGNVSSYKANTHDSITEKNGLSRFIEQTIYISAKF